MTFDSELDSKQTMLAKTAMARQSTRQQDYIFSVGHDHAQYCSSYFNEVVLSCTFFIYRLYLKLCLKSLNVF